MKKFKVFYEIRRDKEYGEVEVNADTREEAKEKFKALDVAFLEREASPEYASSLVIVVNGVEEEV